MSKYIDPLGPEYVGELDEEEIHVLETDEKAKLLVGRLLHEREKAIETGLRFARERMDLAGKLEEDKLGLRNERSITPLLEGFVNLYGSGDLENNKRESEENLVYFVIDLEGFGEVNKKYGEAVGDYLLKEFGERLEEHLGRTSDVVCRTHGDTWEGGMFSISKEKSLAHLESLSENEDFVVSLNMGERIIEVPITYHVGVAEFKKGDSVELLREKAGENLIERRKENGR